MERARLGDKGAALLWGAVLLVLVAAVGVATVAAAGQPADWPKFQKDETNIGYTYDKAPLGVNYAWRAVLPGAIDTEPLVVGNDVIVQCGGNYICCLNKTTGVLNWRTGSLGGGYALSTPAYGVDNNAIYAAAIVTGSGTTLYALNASTSKEIWHVLVKKHDGSQEGGQPNTPVLFYNNSTTSLTDDVVIFGTWASPGTYYCYDAATGHPVWNRTSTNNNGYYWAGAALIGNYVVYGADNGDLTSVEWNNVTNWNVWKADELDTGSGEIRSSISWKAANATYGHLFFTNRTGNKQTKLGFSTSTGKFNRSDWSANYTRYSTSTPTVYDDNEYVGGGNFSTGGNALLNVNVSDLSTQHWAYSPNGAVQSSPAVSIQNGVPYIYFTTNSQYGQFYCVKDNDTSGVKQWEFPTLEYGKTSGWTWLSAMLQGVAISDNWVYGGNDGKAFYGLSNVTPKAYGYEVDDSPGCSDPNDEFTAADYAKIRVNDNNFATSQTDDEGYFAAHRFNFSIETPVANVTAINVTWVGIGDHYSGINGADLYIWNFTLGTYELLKSGDITSNKVTLNGEKTSGISNYVNAGKITVLVKQKTADTGLAYSKIMTDYVRIIITTT